MTQRSRALLDVVATETDQRLPFAVAAFVDAVRERFGASVAAMLFYGSCRRVDQPDGLYDLYVIVDRYGTLPRLEAWLAALLPPNVYYVEVATSAGKRRAKCTLISRADFARGNVRWFHSYLWGRFCQPVSLAYVREAAVRDETLTCLGNAVTTFIAEAASLLPAEFDTRTLWIDGLRTSYATELRSEGPDRASDLFAAHAEYYDALTAAAAPGCPIAATADGRWRNALSPRQHRLGAFKWRVRAVSGKLLALARILKAWITFDGGFDYIIWKLERHSGRQIEVPDRVRRHPALYMWGFFWRLYRAGLFR
jgi:hypothetical protein